MWAMSVKIVYSIIKTSLENKLAALYLYLDLQSISYNDFQRIVENNGRDYMSELLANFIQAIDKDNPATDQDINKFVERLVKPRYLPLSYSVTLEDADLNTNADEVEVYAQPQFSITSEATVTIEEGIEEGTIVHTLAANGDDLEFAILSGYDSEKFTINGDGEISIDERPDNMTQSQYTINVEVKDGPKVEDGSNNTAKQLVNIFVKHVHNDLSCIHQ